MQGGYANGCCPARVARRVPDAIRYAPVVGKYASVLSKAHAEDDGHVETIEFIVPFGNSLATYAEEQP